MLFRLAITLTDDPNYLTVNIENFAKSIKYQTIIGKNPVFARKV